MIRPLLVGLLVCLPLSMAGPGRNCAAQDDGPLLPGFESSPSGESPSPAIEAEIETAVETPSIGDAPPVDDGIAPLDADGIPLSSPGDAVQKQPWEEPQMVLPDPPGLQPQPADEPLPTDEQKEPRKKNLWQKSTEKIRTLTRPEPKADVPAKEKSATPNWQLLKRSSPEPSQSEAAERARQQQLQLQQQQMQRTQQQRLQQQKLQQQGLEQQRQQQQRLQMQRLEQQRQQQRTMQEPPQSRWQSQESPQQTYRAQPAPRTGSGSPSSRRQVQGNQTPQYRQPQNQAPRPQQGQKQKRALDPRSAANKPIQRSAVNTPQAPWDIQPTATAQPGAARKPNGAGKSGLATRPATSNSSGAATQAARVPQGRVAPR